MTQVDYFKLHSWGHNCEILTNIEHFYQYIINVILFYDGRVENTNKMDKMDGFDDIQLSQRTLEVADISELLNIHPDLFDEDIDVDDIDVDMAEIRELMAIDPDICRATTVLGRQE